MNSGGLDCLSAILLSLFRRPFILLASSVPILLAVFKQHPLAEFFFDLQHDLLSLKDCAASRMGR